MIDSQVTIEWVDLHEGEFEGRPVTVGELRLTRTRRRRRVHDPLGEQHGPVRVRRHRHAIPANRWSRSPPTPTEASAPVRFIESRCDPHALAEIKQPTKFVAQMQLGDGSVHPYIIYPERVVLDADAVDRRQGVRASSARSSSSARTPDGRPTSARRAGPGAPPCVVAGRPPGARRARVRAPLLQLDQPRERCRALRHVGRARPLADERGRRTGSRLDAPGWYAADRAARGAPPTRRRQRRRTSTIRPHGIRLAVDRRRHVSFRVTPTAPTRSSCTPSGSAVDVLIGRLHRGRDRRSARDGTWARLKACRHCHWVVFDPSKNRSSRWCSMTACGGRHNAREYRRRQRSAG